MNIKYRILGVDPKEQHFYIRYFTDILTENELATEFDYPADGPRIIKKAEGGYPTRCRTDYVLTMWDEKSSPEDIQKIIISNAPVAWLKTQEAIKNDIIDTSMKVFDSVPKEGSFEYSDIDKLLRGEELSDEDIDKLLVEIGEKNGVV